MGAYVKIPGVADVDLPWIKLRNLGPEAIRNEELLAVILRNSYGNKNVLELASCILDKHSLDEFLEMDVQQLHKVKGIALAKAETIVAAFELARRALNLGMGIQPSVSRPQDVLPVIADIKDAKKEHFVAVFLNARNQVICKETVSIGSLNASLVHPREVFYKAVGSSAASVILCHNHLSGDCSPSREDIELTKRMVSAGQIIGIEVLDHLIVGKERFLSMKESGMF